MIKTPDLQDKFWRMSQASVHYFLTEYAYILNRNTGRKVKWEPWQYQLDLLDILLDFQEVILFKARQLGWTWLLCGYADWRCVFLDAARVLYLSQGETEAFDLIDKSKFIINNLPDYLKPALKHPDNKESIDFKTHDSKMQALASTEKAGHSMDATLVIRDELARHPYGEQSFRAVGPAIDAGGQLIDCSTIIKEEANNHFTERVQKALRGALRKDLPSGLSIFTGGESGATLVFGGWRLRPVRQEGLSIDEWFELRVKKKYSSAAIEEQYPATIEQALHQPETTAFFDIKATEEMMLQCQEPLHSGGKLDTRNVIIKVYKLPVAGNTYVVFTDASDGSEDPFHSVILDARTGEGVVEATGMIKADECAQIHDDLVRTYNNAFNSYEVNSQAGGKFSETIKTLNTPNQDFRRNNEGKAIPDKKGWWTGQFNKRSMLYGLEEAVRNHLIISHSRDTIVQFKSCIRKDGEITMVKGTHDDAIMAWAGVWAIRKYVSLGEMKVTSWQSS